MPDSFATESIVNLTNSESVLREKDLNAEISSRKALLASGGAEFDLDLTISAAERLKIGRKNLKKTLGLDEVADMDSLAKELVRDEDLTAADSASTSTVADSPDLEKLSARERSALKRKARMSAKAPIRNEKQVKVVEAPSAIDYSSLSDACWFAERVKENLLNPKWTVRHGALIGLRSLLTHGLPKTGEFESPESWLDFLIADILLLLGLDRFYDFVGETAIAPVKETAAQLLALLVKHSCPEMIQLILDKHLTCLLHSSQWQIQHSGLLAFKHILSNQDTLPVDTKRIIQLLAEGDDDVRATAADVCSLICSQLQVEDISAVMNNIFSSISTDWTGSLTPLLSLLEKLLTSSKFTFDPHALLPFIRDPSSSVRSQVVRLFSLLRPTGKEFLISLMESMALELDATVSNASCDLACLLTEKKLLSEEEVAKLCEIAATPLGSPYAIEMFKSSKNAHDLGFKRADMMVIKEEEALLQRMNLSRTLGHLEVSDVFLSRLRQSNHCLHHLIYKWIGGPSCDYHERECFVEEAGLLNELLVETNASTLSQVKTENEITANLLNRFNTGHALLSARSKAALCPSFTSIFSLLSLEYDSTLQGFFAHELVIEMEAVGTQLKEKCNQLGSLAPLKLIINDVESWKSFSCPNPVWRSSQKCFEALCQSQILVPKIMMLLDEVSFDFYAHFMAHLQKTCSLDMSRLFLVLAESEQEKEAVACIIAHAVRLDDTFSVLEELICSQMQKLPVERTLNLISELIIRASSAILPVLPVFLKFSMQFVNDSSLETRQLASGVFSELVRIAPLSTTSSATSLSTKLSTQVAESNEFLQQLQGPSSNLLDYKMPCPINVQLRPYQQEGLNWLAFLRRFDLHGALCDDMGLGKTLQTLCILAADHFERKDETVQSLIICPPSLCGHWEAEVKAYCPTLANSILVYSGAAGERRNRLANEIKSTQLVITSYDVIRTDIDYFSPQDWNYCILDEGHLIKNSKTKLASAIKSLKTKRRLLLSGTPIQNDLLELWSLFDFLMPGYLGNERDFCTNFAKPIAVAQYQQAMTSNQSTNASALSKWTLRDLEEAEAKLNQLHKQVLPFILRRMKENVLQDLPPKIIQDYTSEMSPIQRIIYDDLLASSSIKSEITSTLQSDANLEKNPHVFKVLQYMRKLCIHPQLVYSPTHPLAATIESQMASNNWQWNDLSIAPKFQMLRELLLECGLGEEGSISGEGHRVLIFAQHKSTLDLIESLVFKAHLPQISYLRLDGNVEASARFPIVTKFNSDPTIDVLLLTTHVGGLGLNLTAADTVIFMDPDWNPMKDLQAMDRAHRLGQKRVVNVYRLLLKDTLEERIMGLQRWKLHVANTVVSQQNSSLQSMNTDDIMNLFESATNNKTEQSNTSKEPSETEKWLQKQGINLDEDSSFSDPTHEYDQFKLQ